MPQHSSGASSRACATMRSSMERGMRMAAPDARVTDSAARRPDPAGPAGALRALGRLERLDLVLVVVVVLPAAADRVLELAHAVADRLADLGEPLGPEDDQRDDEDDD